MLFVIDVNWQVLFDITWFRVDISAGVERLDLDLYNEVQDRYNHFLNLDIIKDIIDTGT